MNSTSIQGLELKSLADGLDVGVRKKEASKDDILVWELNNW